MRTLEKEVETITAMTIQATRQVKRDFANFWMSRQSQQEDRSPSGRAARPPEDRSAEPYDEPPGPRAATEPGGGPPAGHPPEPMRTQGRLGTSEVPGAGASERVRGVEKGRN
jgi:hypothetical protein